MSKEVDAGGRFDNFLDSAYKIDKWTESSPSIGTLRG